MFCMKCGNEIPEGAAFCPGCGTAAGAVPGQDAPASEDAAPVGGAIERGVRSAGGAASAAGGVAVVGREEDNYIHIAFENGEERCYWEMVPQGEDDFYSNGRVRASDYGNIFENPDVRLIESIELRDTEAIPVGQATNKGTRVFSVIESAVARTDESIQFNRIRSPHEHFLGLLRARVSLSQDVSFPTAVIGVRYRRANEYGYHAIDIPGTSWGFVLVSSSAPADLRATRLDVYAVFRKGYDSSLDAYEIGGFDPTLMVEDIVEVETRGVFGTKKRERLAEVPASEWIWDIYKELRWNIYDELFSLRERTELVEPSKKFDDPPEWI